MGSLKVGRKNSRATTTGGYQLTQPQTINVIHQTQKQNSSSVSMRDQTNTVIGGNNSYGAGTVDQLTLIGSNANGAIGESLQWNGSSYEGTTRLEHRMETMQLDVAPPSQPSSEQPTIHSVIHVIESAGNANDGC